MKGGLTIQEMAIRKQKSSNLDATLEWLEGRIDSEKLMTVERMLRQSLRHFSDEAPK